jgi:hypothetical protein
MPYKNRIKKMYPSPTHTGVDAESNAVAITLMKRTKMPSKAR